MELLRAIGGGAFVLTSLVLAPRLLLLAARTRELPELLLGLTLLMGGGLGFVLAQLGEVAAGPLGDAAPWVVAASFCTVTLSSASLWLFNWRVYRADSPAAAALAALGIGAGVLAFVHHLAAGSFHHGHGAMFWVGYAGRSLAYAWAAFESLRYWRLLVRRQALGIADPLVTERFLLWGVGSACAWGLFLLNLLTILTTGTTATGTAVASFVQSICGLAAAIALALAFFPPRVYRRRVEARAGRASAAG